MSTPEPIEDPPVVNMHDAKTHLSRLVDKASHGVPFVIARSGRPLVKVVPLSTPGDAATGTHSRRGFLTTKISFPDDLDRFKEMGAGTITELFEADPK